MAKILLVDDEQLLVKGLKRSLENEGYEVQAAYNGTEALSLVRSEPVDLVVLDIMLPEMDGLEVCRRIRQFSNLPIIMLTARGDAVDKIVGLELGADDYLAKPFNTRELIARIRAILRRVPPERPGTCGDRFSNESGRSGQAYKDISCGEQVTGGARTRGNCCAPGEVIKASGLEIDVPRQRVRREGRAVELTSREFDLLLTLARQPGRIFTREVLLDQVWGTRYFGEPRVVDVYIRRLRQKIEPDTANPRWIMTRWGAGYYFAGAD
ncbi:response regulator transcription factor [Desulfallas thermosapovorans]|uniref:Stage 0 sporulation protein A homolog n=1 Tax=Desulfallas thermosapovorans DSM 6562 TaxID=1121431 RepID=A0A5S4ZT91_9FIRM|nr:response regulator transcription factor [Desulfallas thermosapovorans]TYO95391.1 DNA-binding response OmpR family regulator [Desulfallas thermosapovorans DSM 6562]